MLAKFIRKFLLNLIHLVLTVFYTLQQFQRWFSKTVSFPNEYADKTDVELILTTVPLLKKKVSHLVVMSDTRQHTLSDLASVVIWSLVAGVPYLSFYDITGELQHQEDKFFHEVEQKKKGVPGFIKWSRMPELNGYSNGMLPHTINVDIFGEENGRQNIVQCIHKIVRNEIVCKSKSGELTAQEFDTALSSLYPPIPEPDLVLYSGPLCCTHGLIPWHIRLSEFIQISVNYSIDIGSYLNAFHKYSKCDKRFGV